MEPAARSCSWRACTLAVGPPLPSQRARTAQVFLPSLLWLAAWPGPAVHLRQQPAVSHQRSTQLHGEGQGFESSCIFESDLQAASHSVGHCEAAGSLSFTKHGSRYCRGAAATLRAGHHDAVVMLYALMSVVATCQQGG